MRSVTYGTSVAPQAQRLIWLYWDTCVEAYPRARGASPKTGRKAGRTFSRSPNRKKLFQKNRESSGMTSESQYPTSSSNCSDMLYDENITNRCGFWCRNICHCVAAVAMTRTAAGTRQRLLRKTGTGCQIDVSPSSAVQNS